MTDAFADCLILAGPTGSGKSSLALDLAPPLNAEIVAMDSMTLYRGMDVLTAKPTPDDRARVPHHLLDVLDPGESATTAWWLARAAEAVADIRRRGKVAMLVGGTALYLQAVIHGLFDGPAADPAVRARLEAEADALGPAAFHAKLASIDAVAAARIHPNNVRRVVRALEVYELAGRPISELQTQWDETADEPSDRRLWLDLPREALYSRIDARVDDMFARGLLDEVRRLRESPMSKEAAQALGVKECLAHLDGRATLGEVRERLKTATRQFAKRQLTWFRRLKSCRSATGELTRALWVGTMNPDTSA